MTRFFVFLIFFSFLSTHLLKASFPGEDQVSINALFKAVEKRDLATVKKLVCKGVFVDVVDSKGDTPFHIAIRCGYNKIVEALLKTENPLDLDRLSSIGFTLLHYACFYKRPRITQLLLEEGANPNIACKQYFSNGKCSVDGRLVHIKYLKPLHIAVLRGSRSCVSHLLFHGANYNSKIVYFIYENCYLTVLQLAEKIGSGEVKSAFINFFRTLEGVEKSVWKAAREGVSEQFKRALETGLSFPCKDKEGWSLLHRAAFHGNAEVIAYLIKETDINPNEKGPGNLTPLHVASYFGRKKAVETLLRLRTSIDSKAESLEAGEHFVKIEGRRILFFSETSALGLASRQRNSEVLELLVTAGAKFCHQEGLLFNNWAWVADRKTLQRRKKIKKELKRARAHSEEERRLLRKRFREGETTEVLVTATAVVVGGRETYERGASVPSAPLVAIVIPSAPEG